jgi:hypothetical protein
VDETINYYTKISFKKERKNTFVTKGYVDEKKTN